MGKQTKASHHKVNVIATSHCLELLRVDLMGLVRLNLINHVLALFLDKFACNSALRNLVFRWESCNGSV